MENVNKFFMTAHENIEPSKLKVYQFVLSNGRKGLIEVDEDKFRINLFGSTTENEIEFDSAYNLRGDDNLYFSDVLTNAESYNIKFNEICEDDSKKYKDIVWSNKGNTGSRLHEAFYDKYIAA